MHDLHADRHPKQSSMLRATTKAYRFPVMPQTDLATLQTCPCHVSILFGCPHSAESQGSWRNLPVWRELLCYGQVPWTCYSQGAEELYRQLEGADQCIDHVPLDCHISTVMSFRNHVRLFSMVQMDSPLYSHSCLLSCKAVTFNRICKCNSTLCCNTYAIVWKQSSNWSNSPVSSSLVSVGMPMLTQINNC